MRTFLSSLLLVGALLSGPKAAAVLALPVEYRQNGAPYNLHSVRGVPLSSVPGNPPGSDGRAPTTDDQMGEGLPTTPPTAGQFQGLVVFGATPGLGYEQWQQAAGSAALQAGDTPFSADLAEHMGLPMARSAGSVALILRRAQVGAPWLTRPISLAFGAIVEVPETDENGNLLQDIDKEDYWFPEPYSADAHAGAGYYWSPHARKVFAVQSGPILITWRKAQPYTEETFPADYENPLGPANSVTMGGYKYLLYTKRYVISGSAVKPPRKIYWTERGFSRLGKPVTVPRSRVGAIHFVYNNNVPKTVAEEHLEPGASFPTDGTDQTMLPELRTIWYDETQGSIHAYNREGRVFMELLGDRRPDGQTRVHLGFEVVDIHKQPIPADVVVELGERIVPPASFDAATLWPEPILQPGPSYAYQHHRSGSERPEYYATRETANVNDYLVYWMEEGEQGLRWPAVLARYQLVWPRDVSRYSHYLRPAAATQAEARETAVALPAQNLPVIEYQDALDRPRAFLTEDSKFYTWLDEAHPAHRTLLRFTSGEEVGFERVFSWLDSAVRQTRFTWLAFQSDFSTPPAGARTFGDARIEAGSLHLTDEVSGQQGTFVLDDFTGGIPVESFKAEFMVRMTGTRTTPADGFSFNFGDVASPLDEEGASQGLAVCFDSYDNGPDDVAPSIAIKLDGQIVAAVEMAGGYDPNPEGAWVLPVPKDPATGTLLTLATGDRFVPVAIELRSDGHMDVFYKGVKVLGDVATGYTPRTGRFALGGRTGGEYYAHWIDDLTIVVNHDTADGGNLFAGTVAAELDGWRADIGFNWPDVFTRPRVVQATVEVGQRLAAPAGELGATGNYVAGHINRRIGTSYDPTAYIDPLEAGFEAAALGAIIPVNAIPGRNRLEVWWFRTNTDRAGANAGHTEKGFPTIYWPSVLGQYTIQWPADAPRIVLASNQGSGPLSSLEAAGSIYRQPDPDQDGYNPNEEHAILAGGAAWATRDDLNITAGENYSSAPYVLVRYTAADGRPAITPFQVVREDPEKGWVFDYVVEAGRLLQPPMPLPLLGKPVVGEGEAARSLNSEPDHGGGDLPGGWDPNQDAGGMFGHYARFTWEDRHHDFWVYRGPHGGLPPLEAGAYDPDTGGFGPLPAATAVVGQEFRYTVHVSRQAEYLALNSGNLPVWLHIQGLSLVGVPTAASGSVNVDLVVRDLYSGEEVPLQLSLTVVDSGSPVTQEPLELVCDNPYTGTRVVFTNRPPFLAAAPHPTNSFTMRYYYQTEATFDWPGLAHPPSPGSIVPYLRPRDPDTGEFIGDPASSNTESLDIVYRPVWPVRDPADASKPLPTLPFGMTLTTPWKGLPGVRDMLTAKVLYQQSIAQDIRAARPSLVLHDPTREKEAALADYGLSGIPGGVYKVAYEGRWYFPNLPPHLAKRLFYDPNRSAAGSLVFRGEFVDETLGDDYLLLNVLRGSDLQSVKDLCPAIDPDKPKWDALVDGLSTDLETFHESPVTPGLYEPDAARTVTVGVGDLAEIVDDNTAVDSYALSATGPGEGYVVLVESGGAAFTQPGDPVALHVFKVGGSLYPGEIKVLPSENPLSELVTLQHTLDLAGRFDEFEYEWKIAPPADGLPPEADAMMSRYQNLSTGTDQPRYTLGGAGIRTLADNYVVLRYRPKNPDHPLYDQWSEWTRPALAEGWIKRVLAGINPFNQRIKDLFNNRVDTDVSLLTQAGPRWEGDIALNLQNINDHGLIEIYETVLRRGRALSIEAGYNYGPANDALLLAAGYLNDLYVMLGDEAWADAEDPTIGIDTADRTYGEIATALFAFKGQVPSLLEEELALLRGRDDFLLPGVEVPPVYNRLVWNYTRGIDAGEVIYALNYNIKEDPTRDPDGVIDAKDAARMYPQGHGDAYGHYLTALKGYYSLLLNNFFDWVPRIEAVNVLATPVSVDYQDERKFAATAAALARTGRQIFDLTWRRDYQSKKQSSWAHFGSARVNSQRQFIGLDGQSHPTVRYWAADHWACRTGQGAYLNWVVGNAILPAVDPNPNHEGIQKVDRTTVPELQEIAHEAGELQAAMDNAENGMTPLGIPEDGLVFDFDPGRWGQANGTHFEQIYERAVTALRNAVAAFDDAKNVTALMHSEQDMLAEYRAQVARQEVAYNNALIELYGTPYPDDMGPGKLYEQDYEGPDLIHYMYVDLPELDFPELWSYSRTNVFRIDVQDLPEDWATALYEGFEVDGGDGHGAVVRLRPAIDENGEDPRTPDVDYVEFHLGPHGYFQKPAEWTSRRASPGAIQQAISEYIMAHMRLRQALQDAVRAKKELDKSIRYFEDYVRLRKEIRGYERDIRETEQTMELLQFAIDVWDKVEKFTVEDIRFASDASSEALPGSMIVGLASGGDLTSAARSALEMAGYATAKVFKSIAFTRYAAAKVSELLKSSVIRWWRFDEILPRQHEIELKQRALALGNQLAQLQDHLWTINQRLRELEDATRKRDALIAKGERIQQERRVFRQRAAAVIQGYRTRDVGFRIFRDEKLERYKTLFDLAARYALLAANVYDYETGLLQTEAGRRFIQRILAARALGVVRDGQPQYAGSDTGDPGLSSVLAEMKADWDVLRGRLGFNNPDAYGTTVSLRTEAFRILPTSDGDAQWHDLLQAARTRNILEDADVRRYCLQADPGDGLPVPGLILSFSTTIADGLNLFGKQLAAGDHAFSPSSFATKIFAVGVALEGYRGMDDPAANSGAVTAAGGVSPGDPSFPFLDPKALSATPYVYLIPVGVDSLRTPPLGDADNIRTWQVADLALPMPFNVGASEFSENPLWTSINSLSEPWFAIRKHQAFRPVSSAALFSPNIYTQSGGLLRSQFTNNRLLGRSVWNSHWKLVIPGRTLLHDPEEGLDRFVQTVRDIKLHFVTYSYSGN